jgi:hypothetical protein
VVAKLIVISPFKRLGEEVGSGVAIASTRLGTAAATAMQLAPATINARRVEALNDVGCTFMNGD